MFYSPRTKAHICFLFFLSRIGKIQDFFSFNYKKKFFFMLMAYFSVIFLKRHTYHGGFQKYFIRSGKVLEYTAIAGPRKNGRKVPKQLLCQRERIEKLLLQTPKENQEKQLEFQKQLLELTSLSNLIENEFSFSQNTIWSAIENFSYFPRKM